MNVNAAVNIADLERLARRRLPNVIAGYLCGGAEDEITLARNRSAFADISFRPRVLGGYGNPDLSIALFGTRFKAPFLIGPSGLNGLFWKDGDLHLARAAAEAGIGFTLSAASNATIETVGRTAPGPKWFQLYPWGDGNLSRRLVQRAGDAGYEAIVVTVDALTAGKRERDIRNSFAHDVRITPRIVVDGLLHPRWLASVWLSGGMPRMENLAEFNPPGSDGHVLAGFIRANRNPFYSWEDVKRLRDLWPGPLLVKGVLHPDDARQARLIGLQGVVVSNHGGRQLDGAPATIDVLPEIVRAVSQDTVVLVDSGFRRGSDIVKAMALGAHGVLLGRATLFGLAAAGKQGVDRAIAILRDEVSRTMALIGARSIADLSPAVLRPADVPAPSPCGDVTRPA